MTPLKTVLFLDDDEEQKSAMQEILEDAGYRVLAFSDPLAALPEFEKEQIDLLITDYSLPWFGGLEIIHMARKFQPVLPVLVISGLDAARLIATEENGIAFFQKPINIQQFLTACAEKTGTETPASASLASPAVPQSR